MYFSNILVTAFPFWQLHKLKTVCACAQHDSEGSFNSLFDELSCELHKKTYEV